MWYEYVVLLARWMQRIVEWWNGWKEIHWDGLDILRGWGERSLWGKRTWVKVWVQNSRGRPLGRWREGVKEYMCERGAIREGRTGSSKEGVFGQGEVETFLPWPHPYLSVSNNELSCHFRSVVQWLRWNHQSLRRSGRKKRQVRQWWNIGVKIWEWFWGHAPDQTAVCWHQFDHPSPLLPTWALYASRNDLQWHPLLIQHHSQGSRGPGKDSGGWHLLFLWLWGTSSMVVCMI